jgi:ComF family protein
MAVCADCLLDLPWLDRCCTGCARPLAAGTLCGLCAAGRWPVPTLAALAYEYPVDRLISSLKYRGERACGRALGELLAVRAAEAHAAAAPLPDRLVPVPLHNRREWQRGYNQAELIARQLGADLGLRVTVTALRRVRDTPAQALLGRAARAANMQGAFRCDASLAGLRVAIIDDVVTTGATALAAATAVKAAGAARVEIWAVARTP